MPKILVRHATGRDFYDDCYSDSDDSETEMGVHNELNLSSMKFYGRKEELQLLHNTYNNVISSSKNDDDTSGSSTTTTSNIVLIDGYCGTGKSTLVKQFIKEVKAEEEEEEETISGGSSRSCFVLSGKFDEHHSNPFSAIVEAFCGFSTEILQGDMNRLKAVQECIQQQDMGPEALTILTTVVPNLQDVIHDDDGTSSNSNTANKKKSTKTYKKQNKQKLQKLLEENCNNTDSNPDATASCLQNRLKYVFRTFLQAICTENHPLILHLDDLQWIDSSSLDLITHLLADTSLEYFMFIGSIRYGNDDINHQENNKQLIRHIENISRRYISTTILQDSSDHSKSKMTIHSPNVAASRKSIGIHSSCERIHLLNLSIVELNILVADALELLPKESNELTEVLYSKTRGNILFTIELLYELGRKNALYYSKISFQWEWNIKQIKNMIETNNLSNNVVDVIADKIKSTPRKLQNALTVAAYLRSNFDVDTLHLLVDMIITPPDQQHKYANEGESKEEMVEENQAQQIMKEEESKNELSKILDMAVLQGMLVNKVGSKNYKFSHDKIQEVAYSLIRPGRERDQFRFEIGKRLFQHIYGVAGQNSIDRSFKSTEFSTESFDLLSFSNHNNKTPAGKGISFLRKSNGGSRRYMGDVVGSSGWMLYIAADHMNSIGSYKNNDTEDELLVMSRLNFEVGDRALAVAAFLPALDYLKRAHAAITQIHDHWSKHYRQTLVIYRSLANVELLLGHFDSGYELSQELLENAYSTNLDKIPTYMSLGSAYSRKGRHKDSLELHWEVLQLIGEKRKTTFEEVVLLCNLIRAKRFFQTHTDDEILNLPILKDKKKLAAMQLYDTGTAQALRCGDLVQYMLMTLRRLRMSFKYGLCSSTALAYSQYAMYVGKIGNQTLALRLTNLAKQIMLITKAKRISSQTLSTIGSYVEGFSANSPLEVVKLFEKGHKSGMETGNLEYGFVNWMTAIQFSMASGKCHLEVIQARQEEVAEQLRIYNVDALLAVLNETRLLVLHLTGRTNSNHTIINENENGKTEDDYPNDNYPPLPPFIDWRKLNDDLLRVDNKAVMKFIHGYTNRLALATYFRDEDNEDYIMCVEKWIRDFANISMQDFGFLSQTYRIFYSGLLCSSLARYCQHGATPRGKSQRYYIKKLKKYTILMKKLYKARQMKMKHFYKIMEAELRSFEKLKIDNYSKHQKTIQRTYDYAIETAMKVGAKHDAALAHELAGEYFLSTGEEEMCKEHFIEARNLYDEWGAVMKVEELIAKRGSYCLTEEEYNDVEVTGNGNTQKKFALTTSKSWRPRTKFTASTMFDLTDNASTSVMSTSSGSINRPVLPIIQKRPSLFPAPEATPEEEENEEG